MTEFGLTDQIIAGRYRVLSPLGEGAMGSVYLAEDTQLRRQVALKVMRKEWADRPEVRKRLENECRLMAHLGPHTNIVTLFDRLVHEEHVILVLEYVPGESLAEVLERTRSLNADTQSSRKTTPVIAGMSSIVLGPRDAVTVVAQCLDALGFAHSKGILHRDLKPNNIMVSRDHNGNLQAKLMDFGIGKALHDGADPIADRMTALTRAGGPGPGTPLYMAPEQIDKQRFGESGPAADLYALGITLYELLTQRTPFEGTYTELLHAHTNVEPPDPRKLAGSLISPDLQRVMLRSLRKDPKARYQSAAEFKMDLQAALGGGTLLSGTYDAMALPAPTGTRQRGLLLGALLVVAVGLVAGGVWLSMQDKSGREEIPQLPPPPENPDIAATEDAKSKASQARAAAETMLGEGAAADTAFATGNLKFDEANHLQQEGKYAEALGAYEEAVRLYNAIPVPPPTPTGPPQEFIDAKDNALRAKQEAEVRFAQAGASADSPRFRDAYESYRQAEEAARQAEASHDWVAATRNFNAATQQFAALSPPPPPTPEFTEEEKALSDAEADFEKRFANNPKDPNYQSGKDKIAEAQKLKQDALSGIADWSLVTEKYRQAADSLKGLKPARPPVSREKAEQGLESANAAEQSASAINPDDEKYKSGMSSLKKSEEAFTNGNYSDSDRFSREAISLFGEVKPAPDPEDKGFIVHPPKDLLVLSRSVQSSLDRLVSTKSADPAYQKALPLNTKAKRLIMDKNFNEARMLLNEASSLLSGL